MTDRIAMIIMAFILGAAAVLILTALGYALFVAARWLWDSLTWPIRKKRKEKEYWEMVERAKERIIPEWMEGMTTGDLLTNAKELSKTAAAAGVSTEEAEKGMQEWKEHIMRRFTKEQ